MDTKTWDAGKLTYPLNLGPDPRGVVASPFYRSFLIAGFAGSLGTGGGIPSPKFGRSFQCLSTLEVAVIRILHLNRNVLDLREQYAQLDAAKLQTVEEEARQLRRNEVPSLDVLVTLGNPIDLTRLRYCGLSIKPRKALKDRRAIASLIRDRDFCRDVGWKWQLVTEDQIDGTAALTAKQLLAWASKFHGDLDVAFQLGKRIERRHHQRELQYVFKDVAPRVGLSVADATTHFGMAALQGWISINPTKPLALRKPLALTF